ncbi:hypothetical protein C3J94_28580, partial [Klebsiella pneumoniae subsp. pneumoniae]
DQPMGCSSGESWTMGATLIQPCRVSEEGLRVVKLFQAKIMTVPEEAPANSVPAAAVIRRGLALFGITGRKAHVGGLLSQG